MNNLLDVWREQPSGFLAVSSKQGKKWEDFFFKTREEVDQWIKENRASHDLYFCTTTLKAPKRTKENVQASRFLWQDLDAVDPRKLPAELKPTLAWESSPKRYQALWKLNTLYGAPEVESLNKRLAYAIKADKGSWILTKVLRIPGTLNFKYPSKPAVKPLWLEGPIYTYKGLEKLVGEAANPGKADSSIEAEGFSPAGTFDQVLKANWKKFNLKVKNLLMTKHPQVGKRSEVLWYLEHELVKAGLKRGEIYSLIKGSPWNKFKGRSDEHERLYSEISKAFEDEAVDKDVESNLGTGEDSGQSPVSMKLENDNDLLSNLGHYPGWLVEGFWTRKSHGMVSGEPKSFKSTLVLDMAISVASGKPFLGKFSVIDKGPVLIIQNENAGWIMKDRAIKIRNSKHLVGKITINKDKSYSIEWPPELPIYYLNQQGFTFSDPSHKEILEKILDQIHPKLIVFDPLYLMFEGDINSSKDLAPLLSYLLSLKEKYQLSILIIHHWKKNTMGTNIRAGQRMLGSTTLHGWVESAWYIEVKGGKDAENVDDESSSDKTTQGNDDEAQKKPDKDEGQIEVDFNTPGADVSLTLEREFRGAGTYPKIDLKVSMGDFGSSDYKVEISDHVPQKERGRRRGPSDADLKEEIRQHLSMKSGSVSTRELAETLGVGRKKIDRLLEEIYAEKSQKMAEVIE